MSLSEAKTVMARVGYTKRLNWVVLSFNAVIIICANAAIDATVHHAYPLAVGMAMGALLASAWMHRVAAAIVSNQVQLLTDPIIREARAQIGQAERAEIRRRPASW